MSIAYFSNVQTNGRSKYIQNQISQFKPNLPHLHSLNVEYLLHGFGGNRLVFQLFDPLQNELC